MRLAYAWVLLGAYKRTSYQLPAAHTAYHKSVNIMAPLKLPWCFLHFASMVKTGILPHGFFSATEGIDLSSAEWRFTSGRLFAHESYSCRSSCFGSLIWAVAAFPPLLAYAVVQQLLNLPHWPSQQQEWLFSNSRKSSPICASRSHSLLPAGLVGWIRSELRYE